MDDENAENDNALRCYKVLIKINFVHYLKYITQEITRKLEIQFTFVNHVSECVLYNA